MINLSHLYEMLKPYPTAIITGSLSLYLQNSLRTGREVHDTDIIFKSRKDYQSFITDKHGLIQTEQEDILYLDVDEFKSENGSFFHVAWVPNATCITVEYLGINFKCAYPPDIYKEKLRYIKNKLKDTNVQKHLDDLLFYTDLEEKL